MADPVAPDDAHSHRSNGWPCLQIPSDGKSPLTGLPRICYLYSMTSTDSHADRLMLDLLKAQAEFAQAKADADLLTHPARERREEAVRAALAGGISLRVAAQATGLSHMRISQLRDGK
jgi:hypothetical protein